VRDRSHWNSPNIKPRHPVALGLCTMAELDAAVSRANRGKKTAEPPSAEDVAAEDAPAP
jgi:hypothetical protein